MGLLSPYKISIVQSKLTPEEVARLDALAEGHGAKTSTDIDQADIIITAIGARQRLQRHLNVDEAISFHHIGRHYGEGRDDSPDDETDHSAGYLSDTEINEFLNTGGIAEARGIAADPRFQALSQFSSIYTIGPTTARYYYDDLGVTTIEDVCFIVFSLFHVYRTNGVPVLPPTQLEAYAESLPDDQPAAINLRAALGYREDFAKGIPRAEVEEIARVVDEHLQAIAPGAKWTICGGYRRGKSVSNDVDIIATHHNIATFKGLCQRLTERLRKADHSSFSSEHPGARNRHFGSKKKLNFDSLDKALTAFRLPARRVTTNVKDEPSDPDTLVQAEHQDPPPHQASPDTSRPPPRPIKIESGEVMKSEEVSDDVQDVPLETFDETSTYRRVDLVFAPPVTYWTAVVGWTGSTQFERDLRLWANQMGLHFDSTGM
ncbi:hypothetical protein FRC04_000746 [Tulasnella sp. 424]|nr:hypothetical protein FRC04_000746 [Tulasnella sp. 424]